MIRSDAHRPRLAAAALLLVWTVVAGQPLRADDAGYLLLVAIALGGAGSALWLWWRVHALGENRVTAVAGTALDLALPVTVLLLDEGTTLLPALLWLALAGWQRMRDRMHLLGTGADAGRDAVGPADSPASRIEPWDGDVRAPLRGIVALSDLLGTTRLAAEQRECAALIRRSALDALQRLGAEPDPVLREPPPQERDVSLRDLVRRWRELFEAKAQARDATFLLEAAASLPDRILADGGLLTEAMLVLVDEALGADPAPQRLLLRVACPLLPGPDTPRGLELALARHPPPRGDTRRDPASPRPPSADLQTILHRLKARLDTDSAGGESCLTVPVRAPASSASSQPARSAEVIAFGDPYVRHRARTRSMRLLLAVPDASVRLTLERILQRAGHVVSCAEDSETVSGRIEAEAFDAALLDAGIGPTGGLDLVRQLHRMQAPSLQTPVLMLSGDGAPETRESLLAAGALRCLGLPPDAEAVLEALAAVAALRAPFRTVPEAMPGPPGAAAVRLDVLRELAQMNLGLEFLRDFVEQCLVDIHACLDELRRDGAESRWAELRETARTLHGLAQHLGADGMAQLCLPLMREPEATLRRDWRRRAAELDMALASSMSQVRAEVERLSSMGQGPAGRPQTGGDAPRS